MRPLIGLMESALASLRIEEVQLKSTNIQIDKDINGIYIVLYLVLYITYNILATILIYNNKIINLKFQ